MPVHQLCAATLQAIREGVPGAFDQLRVTDRRYAPEPQRLPRPRHSFKGRRLG